VGLLETLMIVQIMDDYTAMKTSPNREVLAQGLSNLATGLFAGMGGNGMIAQCILNLHSGGFRRLSIFVGFLLLLLVDTVAYESVNIVPLSALVGVMWFVTFYSIFWDSFLLVWLSVHPKKWREKYYKAGHQKINRADALVILAVTVMVVCLNMALAVGLGTAFCGLVYAWNSAQTLTVVGREDIKDADGKVVKAIYRLQGPLFFGSAQKLSDLFNPRGDPPVVEIHCTKLEIYDFSALDALNALAGRYSEWGKELHLKFLQTNCHALYSKAKHIMGNVKSVEGWEVTREVELGDEAVIIPEGGIFGNYAQRGSFTTTAQRRGSHEGVAHSDRQSRI